MQENSSKEAKSNLFCPIGQQPPGPAIFKKELYTTFHYPWRLKTTLHHFTLLNSLRGFDSLHPLSCCFASTYIFFSALKRDLQHFFTTKPRVSKAVRTVKVALVKSILRLFPAFNIPRFAPLRYIILRSNFIKLNLHLTDLRGKTDCHDKEKIQRFFKA